MKQNNHQLKDLQDKLNKYEKMEKSWERQRHEYIKRMQLLEEQVKKQKALNALFANKKHTHKRTCSDQQMLIFNQTNISSYYHQPVVLLKGQQNAHNYVTRANLRSHLDGVRSICWLDQFLLSAGSDCLLKIWERDRLKITVREHLAPIYTICKGNGNVFTGGAEGVIRMWNISDFMKDQRPIAQEQLHQDSIWELIQDPINRILASSSSDNSIRLTRIEQQRLVSIQKLALSPYTPTSICYLSDNTLLAGVTNSPNIFMLDIQKFKNVSNSSQLSFKSNQNYYQPNKIIYNQMTNQIISGHQDKCLRFFDPNSYSTQKGVNNAHKTIVAHSDAVTGICLKGKSGYEIITCSHDGTVRVWDLRKYRCLTDISVYMKKYDEGAMCVQYADNGWQGGCVAVGGADGQIKLLGTDH